MTQAALPRPLGLDHLTVLELPPPALIALAARIGYTCVGLRLYPAYPGGVYYELAPGSAALRALRRQLRDDGVTIYDVEFVTIVADFVPARLTAMLAAAAELGAARLSVCADDPEPSRLTANFAALCDLAGGFGMGVDLEFMAWRRVNSLAAAVAVVTAAGRGNGGVLVDALHLARTGGMPADLAAVPPALLRSAQLCDAPAARPASEAAGIQEARAQRFPPGAGALPLAALLAALPSDARLSAEVPMTNAMTAEQRATLVHRATRALLDRGAPAA